MKKLLALIACCSLSMLLHAQIPQPTELPLDQVDLMEMPLQDNKALKSSELSQRRKGRPPHFAVPMQVSVNPDVRGTWESLPGGDLLWRFRIHSPGAKSLNLGFGKYEMPAGAYMLLYSPDRQRVQGPFSLLDNEDHEQLWTPILFGDELVIEVVTPASQKQALRLELSYVNHDFMGFGSRAASGSCNLDVICGAADGWGIVDPHRDIIQSAGMYTLNGIQTCSGALINNARNDCTPYYLTADHCGVSSGNASSMVVYWNYQNNPCRQPNSAASGQPGNGGLNDFNSGAIFRAGYTPSDFALVELDDPLDSDHNPYLAGWSREEVIPTSMIGIHHPGTEEKRISFDNDPGTISGWNQPSDSTHVQVNDWDVGTTEGGSSGSPLFNQDERIIGQLTGGGAACGNNLEDQYGWMPVSWTGGGTPNTRLKDWLDPDDTGVMFIDGKNCAIAVSPLPALASLCNVTDDSISIQIDVSSGFSNSVTLSALNVPASANANFSVNPVSPGGSSTLTLSNLSTVAQGSYVIDVAGTDGSNFDTSNVQIDVISAPPAIVSLSQPANAATGVSTYPQYSWTGSLGADYDIEVATDSSFTNIVDNASGLSGPNHSGGLLQAQTTYYWRVRATNNCGMSTWSPHFTFETANILCQNAAATDVPISISATSPAQVSSTIAVSQTGSITDVNVLNVRGTHSWISDLIFTITSPTGTVVTLISNACDDEDDFHISWDDQASGVPPCPYNNQGVYPPMGSLADFNGENPMGNWVLSVEDTEFFDGGSLDGWDLEICATSTGTSLSPALPDFNITLFPNPSSGQVELRLSEQLSGDAVVQIFGAEGKWLRQQQLIAGERSIRLDTEGLPGGLYLVKVEAPFGALSKRLILVQK